MMKSGKRHREENGQQRPGLGTENCQASLLCIQMEIKDALPHFLSPEAFRLECKVLESFFSVH